MFGGETAAAAAAGRKLEMKLGQPRRIQPQEPQELEGVRLVAEMFRLFLYLICETR